MNDQRDIEETLRKFRHDSYARAKQSVMSAYDASFAGSDGTRGAVAFWKRPIPLYIAAMMAVLMVAGAFLAGRRTSIQDISPVTSQQPAPADGAVTSADIEWSAAENDLL